MSLESSLTSNLATLLDGLRKGDMYRLDNAMLDPRVLSAVLDTEGFGRLERDMNREALLLQLDAVSRFCLRSLIRPSSVRARTVSCAPYPMKCSVSK